METNKIYHSDFLNNTLPGGVSKLIIADPPYFEVNGDFDFIWPSFDHYLADVEKWAIECKRLLHENGTLFWWGDAKKIAYSQVILDKYFHLLACPVWDKGNFRGMEYNSEVRILPPCTERLLMYAANDKDQSGSAFIESEYVAPRNPFALELRKARQEKGVSVAAVAEYGKFYANVNHGGAVTNWERGYNVPTFDQWQILCQNLPIQKTNYEYIRAEYEAIRAEYEQERVAHENKRRFFKNVYNLQEVLRFGNESQNIKKYDHQTPKPEKLTRALIMTCSRPGDLVVVPFSGSGTECAMSVKEGRKTIGFDLLEANVVNGNKRLNKESQTLNLFH